MNAVQIPRPVPPPTPASQAQFNNKMAQAMASGDPRAAVKQYDRPGFSRGGGAWNQAGIDAAQKLAAGIADAYSSDLLARQQSALEGLRGAAANEGFAQELGALQQQNNYARNMASIQSQNRMLGLLGGLLR